MAEPNYTRKISTAETLPAVSADGGHPTNIQKCDRNHFTPHRTLGYFNRAVAKSTAERGNSNNKTKAHNTPNACFFMRKSHTPKIDPFRGLFPMVTCGGQRSIVGCVPLFAVFHPVARYRPIVENSAITLKLSKGVINMIYQFLGISRQHYDKTQAQQIRIQADSETHARAILGRDFVLVLLGRLPDSAISSSTKYRTLTASNAQGVIYA